MAKKRKSAKRSKPPSRERYENENPTMSLRLHIKDRDRLRAHLESSGSKLPDFLLDALDAIGFEKS